MNETFCPHCGIPHEPGSGKCQRPLVNRVLPGGFRVLGRMGRTPLGVLYRAESVDSHVDLQLVVLHDYGTDELAVLRERLSRAAAIEHPNVATVRAIGDTPDGLCFFVFEMLRGRPLSEIVETRHPLPLAEASDLILQAAAGLQAAHEAGVPHGRLSPETVYVTHSPDDRSLVKLIRFELVQHGAEPSDPGEAGSEFAAPERLAGHPPSVSSDVFSLGAVLYYVLAGARPSGGMDWLEAIPEAIRPVLSIALDPLPERRFQTVAVLTQALREGLSAGEHPRWARVPARLVRAAGAGTLVLIVAGTGFWLTRMDRAAAGAVRTPAAARESRVPIAPSEPAPPPIPNDRAAREAPPIPSTTIGAKPSHGSPAQAGPPQPVEAASPEPVKAPPEPVEAAPPPDQSAEPEQPSSVSTETSTIVPPLGNAPAPSVAMRLRADTAPPPVSAIPTRTDSAPSGGLAPPTAPPRRPKQPAPPSATKVPDADAEGRAAAKRALATYAQALESSDLKAVEGAYPGITEHERAAWKKFFGVARDLVVTLNIEGFALAGSEVRMDVQGTYQYWNSSLRRSERAPVRFLATVKRDRDNWRLVAVQ
jgi:serine/threonine protein kinase